MLNSPISFHLGHCPYLFLARYRW